MIMLTRISGSGFVLNCDLIERVDSTPDTVISLVDGKKYVVLESPADVVAAVRRHRGEVIAMSHHLEVVPAQPTGPAPHLAPVGGHGHPVEEAPEADRRTAVAGVVPLREDV